MSMSANTPNHVSKDDYDTLVALLDERRRLVTKHLRSKRLPGRSRLSLAEKLEIDRSHKVELAEVNGRIKALTKTTEAV
jgi:hypothetical protein